MTMSGVAPDYPAELYVEPDRESRNRLTVAFRLILAIPHLFLSGTMGGSIGSGSYSQNGDSAVDSVFALISAGILSIAAGFCAILSWFAILFTGKHPKSLSDFELWVLRWQARTTSYVMLFRDEYPPFGEAEYPTDYRVQQQLENRNRLTVGFRFILLIPHFIVLIFLNIGWVVTTIIAWFAILFTGKYPQSLEGFGLGVFSWTARVQAYSFLLVDQYPPFSLDTTTAPVPLDRTPIDRGW